MKFYVYISDSKVDMLLPQVSHDVKKNVATEFRIDLKILTAKRTAETESEDTRIKRLDTVVAFIKEFGNVGTADEADEYIYDTIPMRWGPYGWWRLDGKQTVAAPVYFGGSTQRTILGLGGSARHVVGELGSACGPGKEPIHSHSATPFLLSYLLREQLATKELSQAAYDHYLMQNGEIRIADGQNRPGLGLDAVKVATELMRGPQQRLEFLAKRLLFEPGFGARPSSAIRKPTVRRLS